MANQTNKGKESDVTAPLNNLWNAMQASQRFIPGYRDIPKKINNLRQMEAVFVCMVERIPAEKIIGILDDRETGPEDKAASLESLWQAAAQDPETARQLKEASASLEDKTREHDLMGRELEKLNSDKKDLENKCSELESNNRSLENRCSNLDAQIDKLKGERNEAVQKCEGLKSDKEILEGKLDGMGDEMQALKNENQDAARKLSEIELAGKQSKQQEEKELQETKSALDRMKAEKETMEKRCKMAQDDIRKIRENNGDYLHRPKNTTRAENLAIVQLGNRVDKIEESIDGIKKASHEADMKKAHVYGIVIIQGDVEGPGLKRWTSKKKMAKAALDEDEKIQKILHGGYDSDQVSFILRCRNEEVPWDVINKFARPGIPAALMEKLKDYYSRLAEGNVPKPGTEKGGEDGH